MASKNGKVALKSNDGWQGYVNWSPTATDKEVVADRIGDGLWSAGSAIHSFLESGYNVSFSFEDGTGAVRVAITGKSKPCPNIGYTLSIRASSVDRCLGLAEQYCWHICQSGDWLIDKQSKEVW